MIASFRKSSRFVVVMLSFILIVSGCMHHASQVKEDGAAHEPKITIYGKSSDYKGLFPPERYVAIAVHYAQKQNVKLQEGSNAYRGIMIKLGKNNAVVVVVILGTTGKYPQHSLYTVRMDVNGRIYSGAFTYADA